MELGVTVKHHKPEVILLLSDCGVIVFASTPSIGVWHHLMEFNVL